MSVMGGGKNLGGRGSKQIIAKTHCPQEVKAIKQRSQDTIRRHFNKQPTNLPHQDVNMSSRTRGKKNLTMIGQMKPNLN